MKRLIFIVALIAAFQNKDRIKDHFYPPPDYSAAHGGKVILYSTEWCGYCKKARAFLNKNKIPFYEYDIEKSDEGYAQYEALGGRGVPLVLINQKTIRGFNPSLMMEYLK